MSSSATTLTLPCRLLAARQRIAGVSRTLRDRPPSSVCQYTTTSGATTVRASPTTSSDAELRGSFLIAGPPRVQCCAQTVPPSCVPWTPRFTRHCEGSSTELLSHNMSSIRPDRFHQTMWNSDTLALRYQELARVDCSPASIVHDRWSASLMNPMSVGSKPGEKYRYEVP